MADLYVNKRLTLSEKEIAISTARSSGPGGQNVNKVNSKVTLHWSPSACEAFDPAWRRRFVARNSNRINKDGFMVLNSERYRDQARNLADARQKLVDLLLECQDAPTIRKQTRPTRASQRRRMDQKTRTGQKKQGRSGSWKNEG